MKKGFTLIETLVAIAILMVAIAGPLDIAEKGLTTAVDSRDQVVATYLAQDLVEFVKNVRDDNLAAASPRAWLYGLTSCTVSTPCIAETSAGDPNNPGVSVSVPSGTACNFFSSPVVLAPSCQLYIDAHNTPGGYYTYAPTAGNQATQFYRTFYIRPIGDGNTALLNVSVYWANGTILNHVIEQTIIFNTLR